MAESFDVIVIGVGGMGSATVYHLAKHELRVLGLEQSNIPHELGSSHGVNRIIRLAYAEGSAYVPLLRRAYELWREAERDTNQQLLIITGGIDAGVEESNIVSGCLRSCEEHAIAHKRLSSEELRGRFPGFRLPKDMVGVYQEDAGFVLSERAIVAQVMAAQSRGAEIRARERVTSWEPEGRGVHVTTNRGDYRADRLVITAGPWVGKLVTNLAALAIPERQVLIWVQPKRPEYFELGVFPMFNLEVPEGRFYGFPIYGVPGFKLGKYHHRGENVEPDNMERECGPDDEHVLRKAIQKYFPDADGPTMAIKTCLFTNSPDEHFILDFHPEFPQVSIAAGFSGHGFKFCSVVGEIMADFALTGGCRYPEAEMFRLKRFS